MLAPFFRRAMLVGPNAVHTFGRGMAGSMASGPKAQAWMAGSMASGPKAQAWLAHSKAFGS